jgi:transposase InsO family protein
MSLMPRLFYPHPQRTPAPERKRGCVAASAAHARIRIPDRPAHSLILAHSTATKWTGDDVNRFRKRDKTRFYSLTPALVVEVV